MYFVGRRRNPGTWRGPVPYVRSPACRGVACARLEVRNSRISLAKDSAPPKPKVAGSRPVVRFERGPIAELGREWAQRGAASAFEPGRHDPLARGQAGRVSGLIDP